MSRVSLQELQRNPNALLDRVEAGEHLVVIRGGYPVAEMRPVATTPPGPRPFGLCVGAFEVPDDFDTPLPEEILREFEGRCGLQPLHRDPFDRLLVAQALQHGLTIVTVDPDVASYPVPLLRTA